MTDWQLLFSEVERVYQQVSRLLQDVDGLMAAGGASVPEGKEKTAGMQGGQQLDKPSWWFPGWVSRHYYLDVGTELWATLQVGVLLHPRQGDDLPELPEPVVTGVAWVYDEGAKGQWFYWMAKAWAWDEDRPVDGKVVTRRLDGYGVLATGHCFAVPLSQICSAADLSAKVVTPLLELAKAQATKSAAK